MYRTENLSTNLFSILPGYHTLFRLGDRSMPKDTLQYGDAPAYDNVISDVFHHSRRFPRHQGQQNRSAV